MTEFRCLKLWENENQKQKLEFQFLCSRKTENEKGISNSIFHQWRGLTKNETRSSNSVFPCRRKTVGRKVHTFLLDKCYDAFCFITCTSHVPGSPFCPFSPRVPFCPVDPFWPSIKNSNGIQLVPTTYLWHVNDCF